MTAPAPPRNLEADSIPAELRALPQWLVWRREPDPKRPGETTKVPYRARQPRVRASSTDPATWAPFDVARQAVENDASLAGVGFAVSEECGIVGVDLDHAINDRGALEPWASEIVALLESYTEVTPSGRGLRIFAEGKLPEGRRKKGDIEAYDGKRFLTVTGDWFPDTPTRIEYRAAELAVMHAKFLPDERVPVLVEVPPVGNGDAQSFPDDVILERARHAASGAKFRLLFDHGDTVGHPSRSEADLFLASLLSRAGADAATVDRLFRRSQLWRPKWDERHGAQTYGASTIARALSGTNEPSRNTKGAVRALELEVGPRHSLAELFADPELLKPPATAVARIAWQARLTMLAALEKRGKSTFLCYCAARKSRGETCLGETMLVGAVLLVWLEEHLADVVLRLKHFGAEPARVYLVPRLASTTVPERVAEIRAHARAVDADVVMIDSLIRLTEGVVSDATQSAQMHPVVQALATAAHEDDTAYVLTHHMKKDGSGYRDSSAIGAAVDMIAEMTVPDETGDPTRRQVKLRGRFPARDFEYRYNGDELLLANRDDLSIDMQIRDIMSLFPGISLRGIRERSPGRAAAVDAAVKHLTDRGLIVDRGNGKGHRYYVLEKTPESPNSLADKGGHGLLVRPEAPSALGTAVAKSLWDNAGHGADTIRATVGDPRCVPVSPLRGTDTGHATPEVGSAALGRGASGRDEATETAVKTAALSKESP